jgi:hypothetical protein
MSGSLRDDASDVPQMLGDAIALLDKNLTQVDPDIRRVGDVG